MLDFEYLSIVTKREFAEEYFEFFRRHGLNGVVSKLCNGTASDTTLAYLSLEKTEKIMFETIVPTGLKEELKKGLIYEMNIGDVGNGIATFIPIDGVGGKSSLKYFVGDVTMENKESVMEKDYKSVVIIAVVDKGNTDTVMDAARSAGAGGGTVVRAKGTGAEMAKFFGVSMSEEKEMVYIVAKSESRDGIMRAIMDKAGKDTDAHGVIFSLPVDSVVGIRGYED